MPVHPSESWPCSDLGGLFLRDLWSAGPLRLASLSGTGAGGGSYRLLSASVECVSARSRDAFCWLVGLGWLANLIVGMTPAVGWEPVPYEAVTPPMMLVLGAAFAVGRRDKGDNS